MASIAIVVGCAEEQTDVADKSQDVIRNIVERGPLKVTTEISPAKPRLSDEPTFTLTYEFEKGVVVNKPPFGKALGQFDILGFREPPATTDGDHDVEQQIYRLEPSNAGELKISPIKVTFRDGRKGVGDQQQHELITDEIVVPVTTMLGDEGSLVGGPSPTSATGPDTDRDWLSLVGLAGTAGAHCCRALLVVPPRNATTNRTNVFTARDCRGGVTRA